MTSRRFGSLLVFLPLALAAQSLQERTVPLSNWAAPRHLPRSRVQAQQRVATPKFQLSGGISSDVLVFVPLAPCRLADTRPSSGHTALGSTPLAANTPRNLPIAGACSVPTGGIAEAYSLDVTVVPVAPTDGGYLLAYPNPETPVPVNTVASMTWNPSASYQSNAVITAASSDGSVNIVVNNPSDVVVDINGYYAAPSNSGEDTALGTGALATNAGDDNTAFGFLALNASTGSLNTAIGDAALSTATTGSGNVAVGDEAILSGNGNDNTALGTQALQSGTGSNNIAVGYQAGLSLTAGSNNIMIGSEGTSSDAGAIRIGDSQTSTYVAGIFGTNVINGVPVYVNSTGLLGTSSIMIDVSPRSAVGDIQGMGDATNGLMRLRPVTFHPKSPNPDGSKPLLYGLIAEEVAGVYPEFVARGKDGQLEAAQFSKLPILLLNELQKEYWQIQEQSLQIQALQRLEQSNLLQRERIQRLEARLAALEAQLSTNATAPATPGEGHNH
jgi:hypothetical protein